MTRVHVLTEGFETPNGAAFLYPILRHQRCLARLGIKTTVFKQVGPRLTDCDALLVDSKYYRDLWLPDPARVLDELAGLRERARVVIWCDTSDSTGALQSQVGPYVALYCKNQLLRDRSAYTQPHYGQRVFTHHYHEKHGVLDDTPTWSDPVGDTRFLERFRVLWNSALADYSALGPYLTRVYRRTGFRGVLRGPKPLRSAAADRPMDVSCRIGTSYHRATVSHQRIAAKEILGERVGTGWLTRKQYLDEMCRSKVVVSPFGLGEIAYRDYETFLCGSLLVKPDMSHLETFPDLYVPGETVLSVSWDLEDLLETIDEALSDDDLRMTIARNAQERYDHYLNAPMGAETFASHFEKLIREGIELGGPAAG